MKFYEEDWFVFLMLILCFPYGLFLMWKYSKWHKKTKKIISAIIAVMVVIAIFSDGSKESKNIETKNTNAEVETVDKTRDTNAEAETAKANKIKELQEKSKAILDNKDYYAMNEDERKTINELVEKWDDEIDYNFKSEYADKKVQYENDKYYDENYQGIIIANVQEAVKEQLLSPKSADFPWSFNEYNITYQGESEDGLYMYSVESYVDSENAFGVEIRNDYICMICVTKDLKQYRAVVVFNNLINDEVIDNLE